jgi:serine/threonine protein kinase
MSTETMVECPHCHRQTSTITGFCDECGLELATEPIKPITAAQLMASGELETTGKNACPNCGHALRLNAKHCPNCGKKLIRADSPAQSQMKDGPPSVLDTGQVIADRYGLENVLGEGGMGRVWKAFDRHLNKYVVIKTVLTPDEALRKALQKEAEVLINIRHPNIVAVIDFFTVQNELCYVMEFVSGPSWADEIEEPVTRKLVLPMSAEDALLKLKGVLPAFKYLHGLNPPIIYCDFKPANVKNMVLANGDTVEVLLDFGTAYLYDPKVPPKPARGTPGYHSPNAAHPDWRDDYFTIGRTVAELVGMAEVHQEQYRYTLTPHDQFPWLQYDESFRYFLEWLTAPNREDRPQNVDAIMAQLDGVIGYVKGQKPDKFAFASQQRTSADFSHATQRYMSGTTLITGTVRIDMPDMSTNNPAATILLSAQEAYQQNNMTRALLLANQALNNNGGAAALVLRSLIYNQRGEIELAEGDLERAQQLSDPQVQWEMLLAEGQLLEAQGKFAEAAECYKRMMALKPGDHRGRLLLADLFRRSGNQPQAITAYKAIIQAKPSVGAAYLGVSKAYVLDKQIDEAIKILQMVSSRNASFNEVQMELIQLYNDKASNGSAESLDFAARAIETLQDNGVETRQFYRLVAEFYFTAFNVARRSNNGKLPQVSWPGNRKINTLSQLARANEQAWREYLIRDKDAKRDEIINDRIMAARTWALV